MKPQLLKVTQDLVHSFSARRDNRPDVNNRWHYHPEVELVFFKKGNGTQYIGDSIHTFQTGDIVLVGANLPHFWQFDSSYFNTNDTPEADIRVIHFKEDFWGETFLNLPENIKIKKMLERAKLGLKVSEQHKEKAARIIEQIIESEGVKKLILLLDVLLLISQDNQNNQLASIGFQYNFHGSEKDRINAIYNYTIANFKQKITLIEIAAIANVSPNSFCKFFKSKSRKTYSLFLNEIRIGHACRLLIDNQLNVKEICYKSGYNNFASFHKFFKQITGTSPLVYQKAFIK